MKLSQAHHLALALIEHLSPACDRISIAGSIRRQKPEPKDCELVIIPRYRADVLTGNPAPMTDDVLAELIGVGKLSFDQQVKRNGPKYKRLVHTASGLVFELFFCAPDNWGCIYTLRTGPGEFSRMLVTKISQGGAMPLDSAMSDGYLWTRGVRISVPEEHDLFTALDLPCWEPQDRTAELLKAFLSERRHMIHRSLPNR